jgi:uncharacterized protein (DUF1810 family)
MVALRRFRQAQDAANGGFESALDELRTGAKRGHWIWFVFPQIAGLGNSAHSQMFGINGAAEAVNFLRDAELRSRYLTIGHVVAEQLKAGRPLRALMGSDIDAKTVVSSLTLFGLVARRLYEADGDAAYGSIAAVADEVLSVAKAQGYPPCAYTLDRLRPPDE